MLKLAWAYLRYSSSNQREESIWAQRRECEKYALENDYKIVKFYIDERQSAKSDDRKDFQQMIHDSELPTNKDIHYVMFHKIDRFSRDSADFYFYQKLLKTNGKSLVSVVERLDNTPESRLMTNVLSGVSSWYIGNLAREVKKGHTENILTHRTGGGCPVLGLKVDKETLLYEIDEPNAEAIRILFKRFVHDRWSYKQIAEELNSLGFHTARGNNFTAKSSLIDLLENNKFCGDLIFRKSITDPITGKRSNKRKVTHDELLVEKDAIPAIISREDFDKAQELLAERKRKAGSFKSRKRNLFIGKIYCGECGNLMNINSRKSGKTNSYYSTYRCSAKNEKLDKKCTNHEISVEHLERYVLSQLMYFITQSDTVDKITELLNELIQNGTDDGSNEIKILANKIKGIEIQKQNIINAIANAPASATKVLVERLELLENEQIELSDKLDSCKTIQPVRTIVDQAEVKDLLNTAYTYMLNENDDMIRAVIDMFIEKIVISSKGLEIRYYLQPFHLVKKTLWTTYLSRDELSKYKGFVPSYLKGRWSKKAILNLHNSKPSYAKIISLGGV